MIPVLASLPISCTQGLVPVSAVADLQRPLLWVSVVGVVALNVCSLVRSNETPGIPVDLSVHGSLVAGEWLVRCGFRRL